MVTALPDSDPHIAKSKSPEQTRFVWSFAEVSGAFGDLGTFLPHIMGAISVVGMDPTGVLVTFGLFYVVSGVFYGIPMAVQPMKAASAAVLIQPMDAGAVAGASLAIGGFFLILGVTGFVSRLARLLPPAVSAGLQLGLGLSLALLGLRLIQKDVLLGLSVCALMLALMRFPRFPVALAAIGVGTTLSVLMGKTASIPHLTLGFHLPPVVLPNWEQTLSGVEFAVLPQIPLTLTNAIIVTATLSRQLFPTRSDRTTERNLALSTGLGNLLTAPFRGYLMCHGAGGLVGHVRFGARSATAPVVIGSVLITLGLFLGGCGYDLLRSIPEAVLGSLLVFSGIELSLSSNPGDFHNEELFLVFLMATIGVAVNPAIATLVGLPLAYGLKSGWLKIPRLDDKTE